MTNSEDRDADDREHVLEEEDQPVAEEEADAWRSTVARDISWPVWWRSKKPNESRTSFA